jgi:hypothetical protein
MVSSVTRPSASIERTATFTRWPNWGLTDYIAVELAFAIQKRVALVHGATCPKLLSARAVVDVADRSYRKSPREKMPSCRFDLSFTGMCGHPSPRPASSASGPPGKGYLSTSGRSALLSARSWFSPQRLRPNEWRGTPRTSTMAPNVTSMR